MLSRVSDTSWGLIDECRCQRRQVTFFEVSMLLSQKLTRNKTQVEPVLGQNSNKVQSMLRKFFLFCPIFFLSRASSRLTINWFSIVDFVWVNKSVPTYQGIVWHFLVSNNSWFQLLTFYVPTYPNFAPSSRSPMFASIKHYKHS